MPGGSVILKRSCYTLDLLAYGDETTEIQPYIQLFLINNLKDARNEALS